jgi:hypothetical protein
VSKCWLINYRCFYHWKCSLIVDEAAFERDKVFSEGGDISGDGEKREKPGISYM